MLGGTDLRLPNWRRATFIPARTRAGINGRVFAFTACRNSFVPMAPIWLPVTASCPLRLARMKSSQPGLGKADLADLRLPVGHPMS
jgi:hypothetical protein